MIHGCRIARHIRPPVRGRRTLRRGTEELSRVHAYIVRRQERDHTLLLAVSKDIALLVLVRFQNVAFHVDRPAGYDGELSTWRQNPLDPDISLREEHAVLRIR